MTPISTHGMVTRPSRHSVDDTVTRLKALLEAKHITVFALSTTAEKRLARV